MRIIPALTLVLSLAVAAVAEPAQSDAPAPNDQNAGCISSGGMPRDYGGAQRPKWFCERPYPDAGKAFAAKSDCAGQCMLPDDFRLLPGEMPPIAGMCQARTVVGCIKVLDEGRPLRVCYD
jgi:hypothetical protein